MLVRVETSRVGPARLPSAASWRVSSSFTYRIHWPLGGCRGDDAYMSENAREFVWGERVIRHGALARPPGQMKKALAQSGVRANFLGGGNFKSLIRMGLAVGIFRRIHHA